MLNSLEVTIWGKEFSLPIEYESYEEDPVTEQQIEAVTLFTEHPEWLDNAKQSVEQYCKEQVLSDNMNDKKDNIFSYIKPVYFFVEQNEQEPSIALMLNYRYDPEHGLVVVFKIDGEIIVGSQDIIL